MTVPNAVSQNGSSYPHYANLSQVTDFNNGQNHIDIWTGSSTVNGGQNQINCEDNLTFGGQYSIVRNPPTNYGVNSMSSIQGYKL
jgi:hypothetical protein